MSGIDVWRKVMAPELGLNDGRGARQQEILRHAQERYGEGAYFVYPRPSDRQLVTMTLEQAMVICGSHMAGEDNNVLWATLDKWHEAALRLEAGHPARFETSLTLGRNALALRGLGNE